MNAEIAWGIAVVRDDRNQRVSFPRIRRLPGGLVVAHDERTAVSCKLWLSLNDISVLSKPMRWTQSQACHRANVR